MRSTPSDQPRHQPYLFEYDGITRIDRDHQPNPFTLHELQVEGAVVPAGTAPPDDCATLGG